VDTYRFTRNTHQTRPLGIRTAQNTHAYTGFFTPEQNGKDLQTTGIRTDWEVERGQEQKRGTEKEEESNQTQGNKSTVIIN